MFQEGEGVQMSELKAYVCGGWFCEKEAYPKDEADKVIAELKQKNDDSRYNIAVLRKEKSHHKYKRCLAMAKWCESKVYHIRRTPLGDMSKHEYWQYENDFWQRWQNRWLELAKKFKEAK